MTPSCGLVTMAWATVRLKKDNDYDDDDDDDDDDGGFSNRQAYLICSMFAEPLKSSLFVLYLVNHQLLVIHL